MTHAFNDLEGLRIAVEMEKRGAQLYQRALRICQVPRAQALLRQLEADERNHQGEFFRLYQLQSARRQVWPDYSLEQSAYLSAMAADVVFPGGLGEMGMDNGFDSPAAILRYAIQAEKDSLLFYGALMEQTGDPESRSVFAEIIRQERGHLAALTQMLREEEA